MNNNWDDGGDVTRVTGVTRGDRTEGGEEGKGEGGGKGEGKLMWDGWVEGSTGVLEDLRKLQFFSNYDS